MSHNLILVSAIWLSVSLTVGCGGGKGSARYIPKQENARAALEKALNAWQGDKPHGTVEKGPPAIEVLASDWKTGRKLASYQILKDETDKENRRWYSVQLKFKDASEDKTVRFLVLGNNPLWVYSEDEYEKLSGM